MRVKQAPGRESPRVLETDLVHELMRRATAELRGVRLFRRNTGMLPVGDRYFRAGIKGQCDLQAILAGGRIIEIECKRYGRLSPVQLRWREWCEAWDVSYLLLEAHKGESIAETVARWLALVEQRIASMRAGRR